MSVLFAIKKSHGMSGKNTHFSNTTLFFTLLTAGLVLFFLPKTLTSPINLFFYDTFQFALQIGQDAHTRTTSPADLGDNAVSHGEYARLWKSYHNLHAQLMTLHAEHERLSRLRSGLPQLSEEGLCVARITSKVSNYTHEVVIDKGSVDEVHTGQFVLSDQKDAIVGVVSDSAETAAKVRLITDAMQTLEVHIRREGTDKDIRAMMVGNGNNTCGISMIERQQDIRPGDTVFAAAASGKLPIPLIVGEVVDVQPDDQHPLLWKITVRPAEDMSRLNHVAVIVTDSTLLERKE